MLQTHVHTLLTQFWCCPAGPPPAAQLPDLLQGEAVATEGELPPKVLTFSYCCIDWPSVVNVARLRLHKAQAELKDKLSDK